MKALKRKFTLRTALLTALTVTLIASAAVFIAVSAAENVTPSDVSPTSATEDHTCRQNPSVPQNVTPSDVSPSDLPAEDALPDGMETVRGHLVLPRTFDNAPENLGEPVITMTTTKAVGEELFGWYVYVHDYVKGQNVYIDYGDGMPVEYPGDRTVKGSHIKIYGENITYLNCRDNQLTALDVSKNTALTELHCGWNQLTALDVSKNTALTGLRCDGNQLTALDVSNNTALTKLYCESNQLTALDVSKNTALTELNCEWNQLTALDVSNNTALTWLHCYHNQLTVLDVSKNTALTELWCGENQLTALDVSKNTALTKLHCGWNQLTALDVSKNTALEVLWCDGNQLTALDVSKNTNLTGLGCGWNQLTALDVSKNTALTGLGCELNQLTALDVSKNTALEVLTCGGNQLTALDVSKNTALTGLECGGNQLTALDVSKNTALTDLRCSGNQLTALDVSKNTALEVLFCDGIELTALDVSKNTALTDLRCSGNQLTALDVSKNTALRELHCESNQLTALDVSKNTALGALSCESNQLTMPQIESFTRTVHYVDYTPQTHVIPSTVKVGDAIDLSSEYSVDGTVTQYTWYDGDGNVIAPATANGGVFTFGEDAVGKKLVCKMTNANLPDFKIVSESREEYDDDGKPTGNMIDYESDNRLTTTEVEIKAADTPDNPTSSDDSRQNQEKDKVPYYNLEVVNLDDGEDITLAGHSEGVKAVVNGKMIDLHRIKGIHLTVGNIETNKKKSVLDAIAAYNQAFDADSENIALYEIDLMDGNNVQVKIVKGDVAIRIKYPDNLARRSEDYVFHLYHQKEDGTIEEIPLSVKPNGLWFYASDFSPYVLYWHEKAAESVGTGESAAMIIVMTSLLALSLAGAGFVLYRRRKQTAA